MKTLPEMVAETRALIDRLSRARNVRLALEQEDDEELMESDSPCVVRVSNYKYRKGVLVCITHDRYSTSGFIEVNCVLAKLRDAASSGDDNSACIPIDDRVK